MLCDLEDRVSRLRTLLEEEEILQEEYRRVGNETRGHLQDAREQVSQYLEEVHSHLAHVESLRTMLCLRSLEISSSSSSSSGGSDMEGGEVDYESLLEALEEDLQVVHTVEWFWTGGRKQFERRWRTCWPQAQCMLLQPRRFVRWNALGQL